MSQFALGILLVLGIIAFQVLSSKVRGHRARRMLKLAEEALHEGDLSRAEKSLKRCLVLAPLWVQGRILRATVLARQGRNEEAEEEFKFAVELEPRQPEGHAQLALFYVSQGPEKKELAAEAFEKALACAPEIREKLMEDPRFAALRPEEP